MDDIKKILSEIREGSVWRHYKGGYYKVLTLAFRESDKEPCVVYESSDTSIVWIRTAREWYDKVNHSGVEVQRFTLV